MNSKAKGEISEAILLAKFISLGYPTLIPFGNNQRYDFVVEIDGIFKKIQCKTARTSNGCVVFNSCSTNGFTGKTKNYRGDIDFFAVYCPDIQKSYLIPPEKVGIKNGILRYEPMNRTEKGVSFICAKDYELP